MTIEQELKQLRAEIHDNLPMPIDVMIVHRGLYGRFNEEGK